MGATGAQTRQLLPRFLTLGAYNPASRIGPAIWLKCMLARALRERRIGQPTLSRSVPSPADSGQWTSTKALAATRGAAVPRGVLDTAQCQGLDAAGVPAIERRRVGAGCGAGCSDPGGDAACPAQAIGDADHRVTGQAIRGSTISMPCSRRTRRAIS